MTHFRHKFMTFCYKCLDTISSQNHDFVIKVLFTFSSQNINPLSHHIFITKLWISAIVTILWWKCAELEELQCYNFVTKMWKYNFLHNWPNCHSSTITTCTSHFCHKIIILLYFFIITFSSQNCDPFVQVLNHNFVV